ncbi:MAG: DMT family transporter [Eubacterium sp.]
MEIKSPTIAVAGLLLFMGTPLVSAFQQCFQDKTAWMILGIAVFLVINYINWYKSIVFIGACRGPAVSNISGFVLLVLSMVFYKDIPDWYTILSASGSLLGVVIIYMDCANYDGLPVLRKKTVFMDAFKNKKTRKVSKMPPPAKIAILEYLETSRLLWDYEIADYMGVYEKNRSSKYREQVREWTVEMRVMGLIEIVQEKIDTGEHFQRGKRLCQYALIKV